MMEIKNLKPEWAVAETESGDLCVYDASKVHLLNPNKKEDELVPIYFVRSDGEIDYTMAGQLPAWKLNPKFVKILPE